MTPSKETIDQPVEAAAAPAGGDALRDFRETTRDQLEAAWQIHVNRVEGELAKGWHEQIAAVLNERFAELASAVEGEVAQATATLNQTARRLRHAADSEDWVSSLLDGAAAFSGYSVLFRVSDGKLTPAVGEAEIEVELSEAPAFESAVQSLEPVTAMATAGELSAAIAGFTPESPDGKVSLFPVVCRAGAVAVLYAHGGEAPVDVNALELLTSLAGAVQDAGNIGPKPPADNLVSIAGTGSRPAAATPASWSELTSEDQDRHLRAQRFSRVQVAELRLYKTQAVKEGRIARDLYGTLRTEIDAGRRAFQKDYMDGCLTMVDYFHLELVRTLANDEEALLGPEYPGPLK